MDNGYNIANMALEGNTLRSNTPINTMMRGAGQPEGHFLMESIMEHVAQFLKMDAAEVRWYLSTPIGLIIFPDMITMFRSDENTYTKMVI